MTPLEKVKWMSAMMRDPGLTESALRVGAYLCDCLNGQSGQCNPSISTMVADLPLSKRSIQNGLKQLECQGRLQVVSRGNGKGNRSEYQLIKGAATDTFSGTPKGANPSKEKVKHDAPFTAAKGANPGTQRVQSGASKGANPCIPPNNPLISEPVKEPVKGTLTRASARESGVNFGSFWERYPRKRSKGQAEKAWRKLSPEQQRAAVDVLPAACRQPQWTKQGGRFIPYPATWLNAKGWADDIETGSAQTKRTSAWLDDDRPEDFIEGDFSVEANCGTR